MIDTNILKGNKKEIYEHLWGKRDLNFNVIKTGKSEPSYEFEFGGKDLTTFVGESLAEVFSITDKNVFLDKFRMACSGNGEELKKITTLHSSSLCALLFFFNVSDKNPLHFKNLEGYEFTQSFFEFKNKVIGYPSNVDVVLLGQNKEKKNVILFLESKFSEYITGITKAGNKYNIGKSYFSEKKDCYSFPIYKEILDSKVIELSKVDDTHLSSSQEKYIEGIKQIISHYYGICNFMNGKYYEKDNENLNKLKNHNAEEFLLGEILFDNFSKNIREQYLVPYEKDYSTLARLINKQYGKEKVPNFKVIEESFHYSDLSEFISDNSLQKVYDFYFGNL